MFNIIIDLWVIRWVLLLQLKLVRQRHVVHVDDWILRTGVELLIHLSTGHWLTRIASYLLSLLLIDLGQLTFWRLLLLHTSCPWSFRLSEEAGGRLLRLGLFLLVDDLLRVRWHGRPLNRALWNDEATGTICTRWAWSTAIVFEEIRSKALVTSLYSILERWKLMINPNSVLFDHSFLVEGFYLILLKTHIVHLINLGELHACRHLLFLEIVD